MRLLNTYHDSVRQEGRPDPFASESYNAYAANHNSTDRRNKQNAIVHLQEQIDAELLAVTPGALTPGVALVGLGLGGGQAVLHPHRVAPSTTRTTATMTDEAMVNNFTNAVNALWTQTSWNAKTNKQRGEAIDSRRWPVFTPPAAFPT